MKQLTFDLKFFDKDDIRNEAVLKAVLYAWICDASNYFAKRGERHCFGSPEMFANYFWGENHYSDDDYNLIVRCLQALRNENRITIKPCTNPQYKGSYQLAPVCYQAPAEDEQRPFSGRLTL